MEERFVVYLTTYFGNKLPPFYIGSTSEQKALSGKYFGTVKSKKYKEIFKSELKSSNELFHIRILSVHSTRKEALEQELAIQRANHVVESDRFFNESYACPNGYFGRSMKGDQHPQYGKPRSKETRDKIGNAHRGKIMSEKQKEKLRISSTGKFHTKETKEKLRKANLGKVVSEETKQKISDSKKGFVYTKEQKKKLSESHIENNKNPELLKKRREAIKIALLKRKSTYTPQIKQRKQIICINIHDNTKTEFLGIGEAAKILGIGRTSISQCLSGRTEVIYKKYKFYYK